MKKIELNYSEPNKKWYLYIDGNMLGKFYTLSSAFSQLIFREIGLKKER